MCRLYKLLVIINAGTVYLNAANPLETGNLYSSCYQPAFLEPVKQVYCPRCLVLGYHFAHLEDGEVHRDNQATDNDRQE